MNKKKRGKRDIMSEINSDTAEQETAEESESGEGVSQTAKAAAKINEIDALTAESTAENKSEEATFGEQRADGKAADGQRTDGKAADGQRADGKAADGQTAANDDEADGKSDGGAKPKLKITKQQVVTVIKYALLLVALASIRALVTHIFIIPNGFAPGGLSGISSILYNAVLMTGNERLANTVFDPGLTTLIMNVPFIIASFFVLNKKFAVNTTFMILVYSAMMMILSAVDCPQFDAAAVTGESGGAAGYKILAALSGGACTGFCLGMMLRSNMSMGGTDIVGKIIHKHNPSAGAQWWILMCDCIVAICSGVLGVLEIVKLNVTADQGLVMVLTPIFYSFVSLIVGSLTADVIQSGFQSSIVFTVITDKPNDISKAISDKIHRGVTLSTGVGYYTGVEHKVLTCVVSKRQTAIVKKIISEADPLAFTYIIKAGEVAGKGFHSMG